MSTSHFHFFEVNPRLAFDRGSGVRPAPGRPGRARSLRFDPGVADAVALVPIGGARVAIGFAGLVDGPLDAPGALEAAMTRARATGFLALRIRSTDPAVPRDGPTATSTSSGCHGRATGSASATPGLVVRVGRRRRTRDGFELLAGSARPHATACG